VPDLLSDWMSRIWLPWRQFAAATTAIPGGHAQLVSSVLLWRQPAVVVCPVRLPDW